MFFTQISVNKDIELRLLELKHTQDLFRLTDQNRVYLQQWLPWLDQTTEIQHSFDFIKHTQAQFANQSAAVLGIWDQDQLVGVIGHNKIDWANRITYLGYWLSQDANGRGIMTASCQALINHAFQELKLNRIEIRCATQNHKSCAIPKRLGFTHDGIIRDAEWLYNQYVDHHIWSMLAKDWS